MDDKGVWTGAPTGEYRVKNVKINQGGEWVDLDLTASYNLAGYNYTLRDLGDGFAMFDGAINVLDYVMEDYMVLANYVKSFPVNANGLHEIPADDARYASVYGEGRIRAYVPAPEVIAEGWSGYTTWVLTADGTITFSPTEQKLENGETNMKNYWKVNGVLTLPWGEYAEMIRKVVIKDGIHDLGQMAFYELPNLTTVELGADITEIRNYCFKNCQSLTTINLAGVEYIREGAFYGCTSLKDVDLTGNILWEDWAFTKTGVKFL